MELSNILEEEVRKFLSSKKRTILVTGGSKNQKHKVADLFREQTLGSYFVYEFGDLPDFERADPYIFNLNLIPQESS